jgi:hypothetical protein
MQITINIYFLIVFPGVLILATVSFSDRILLNKYIEQLFW